MEEYKILSKPYIGWIEFSDIEQRQVKEFLAKFNQEGTLDELGFGIIRDSFAEKIFPSTSTIMTRARYFIFIPAIMRWLEKNKVKSHEYFSKLKKMENNIRERLSLNESEGVIGKEAKDRLLRYPSNIYWNAIKKLKIFAREFGLTYYASQLDVYYKEFMPTKDDDGNLHVNDDYTFWDTDFPYYEINKCPFINQAGIIKDDLSFDLTKEEALYLKDVYCNLGFSLLSFCLSENKLLKTTYPWEISTHNSEYDILLKYSKLFSWLTNGISIIYYQMLAEKKHENINYYDSFEKWYLQAKEFINDWDINKFIEICNKMSAFRKKDEEFFREISSMLINIRNAKTLFNNIRFRDLIAERERIKRPVKARLKYDKYLEQWNCPAKVSESYFLDYRNAFAKIIINDIIKGLNR